MSAPAVILSADEYAALLKRIEDIERLVDDRAPATARAFLTPREVARRFGVGDAIVYAALDTGRLPAEERPGHSKTRRVWRIKLEDAQAWYATFIAKKPGQPAPGA